MKNDQRELLKKFVSHHLGSEFTEGQHYAILGLLEDFHDTFIAKPVAEGEKVSTSLPLDKGTPTFKGYPIIHQPDLSQGSILTPNQKALGEAAIELGTQVHEDFDEQFEGGVK